MNLPFLPDRLPYLHNDPQTPGAGRREMRALAIFQIGAVYHMGKGDQATFDVFVEGLGHATARTPFQIIWKPKITDHVWSVRDLPEPA